MRPDLRMIGHSGFITVARRVEQITDVLPEASEIKDLQTKEDRDVAPDWDGGQATTADVV